MKAVRITILAVISIILLAGCGNNKAKEIDLMDYVGVIYKGYNGKATASISDSLYDFEDIIMADSESEFEFIKKASALPDTINFSLNKKEGLSNGDTIILTVTWDEGIAKEHGYKFIGQAQTNRNQWVG